MPAVVTSPEIRRCARCGEPALICVRDWQHVVAGIRTASRTLELVCQRCGAKVRLQPRSKIRAARIFAYVMMPAVIPGLIFLARARAMARAWTDNPVVDGATQPARGCADGARIEVARESSHDPPARRCQCGAAARCVQVTQRRMLGVAVDTRYAHTCTGCSRSFVVHDRTGVIFSAVVALVICAMGALLVIYPPGSGVGAARSNQGFGVGLIVLGALGLVVLGLQLRARAIHPPYA